jgi:hypothetical protein
MSANAVVGSIKLEDSWINPIQTVNDSRTSGRIMYQCAFFALPWKLSLLSPIAQMLRKEFWHINQPPYMWHFVVKSSSCCTLKEKGLMDVISQGNGTAAAGIR